MDLAGRRATMFAKVGVEIALIIVLAATAFALFSIGAAMFGGTPPVGLIMVLPAGLIVPGLLLLRAFLRDVLDGQVFTAANARRLYFIAWLLIAASIIKSLFALIATRAFVALPLSIMQPSLLTGLLILVLASAWRYGSELQNERDLTV